MGQGEKMETKSAVRKGPGLGLPIYPVVRQILGKDKRPRARPCRASKKLNCCNCRVSVYVRLRHVLTY